MKFAPEFGPPILMEGVFIPIKSFGLIEHENFQNFREEKKSSWKQRDLKPEISYCRVQKMIKSVGCLDFIAKLNSRNRYVRLNGKTKEMPRIEFLLLQNNFILMNNKMMTNYCKKREELSDFLFINLFSIQLFSHWAWNFILNYIYFII